jgi:hypothetical protein
VYKRNDPKLKMFIISKNQKREPFIFRLIRHPKQQAAAILDDCKKRGKPVDCKGKSVSFWVFLWAKSDFR